MKITLCGSARFEDWFHLWNEILTLSGHTVYGLSTYPSNKKGNKDWYTEEEKIELDKAHLRKIDNSDAIFVLNRYAYIGESTLKEIEYAKVNDKNLYALESWGKGQGICGIHFKSVQEDAEKYGALASDWGAKGSPIDTFWPHFKEVWRLLPEAGEFRSKLAEKADSLDPPNHN